MENKYGLYLSREGTTLRFPVNPESCKLSKDSDNAEYNVLGVGPIMVPRAPKLQKAAWSGLLPGRADFGAVVTSGGFRPPEFYISFLQKAMDQRARVRFVANRCMEDGSPIFDTNMEALVTSFHVEERGGETGDFYYELELTEYRDYSARTVTLRQPAADKPAQAAAQPARAVPAGQLTVGQEVTVNGSYYYSSWGAEPHGTFSGFRGKISRIITNDPQRAFPYHITTPSGGARGWVKKSQIQGAGP